MHLVALKPSLASSHMKDDHEQCTNNDPPGSVSFRGTSSSLSSRIKFASLPVLIDDGIKS